MLKFSQRLRFAGKAASLHFLGSCLVAGLVAALIFGLWFPYPYREMAGGRSLFWLIVAVDVVSGPLLTLVLASPSKPRKELFTDLALVVVLQLGALVYGLYTLSLARPVAVVYEVDRFRMVTAADLLEIVDGKVAESQLQLSWTGPELKGVRQPSNATEQMRATELGLQGIETSMQPSWWINYEHQVPNALTKAQSIDALKSKHPQAVGQIDEVLQQSGKSPTELKWLPLVSRRTLDWVVFLDQQGQPSGYLPLDGF